MTDGDGASVVLRAAPSRRHRCWSCTAIRCVHIIQELCTANFVMFQSNGTGTTYLRYNKTGFVVPLHSGRSDGQTGPTCFCFIIKNIIFGRFGSKI